MDTRPLLARISAATVSMSAVRGVGKSGAGVREPKPKARVGAGGCLSAICGVGGGCCSDPDN